MDEINMTFYTEYYREGYQLGIDIELIKNLPNDKYNSLCNKIAFIFKHFKYGMNIIKIIENIKAILSSEGIQEFEITRLEICIVNNKFDNQNFKIVDVKKESLLNFEYMFDKDREKIIVSIEDGKLTQYIYSNMTNKFEYIDNNLVFVCNSIVEESQKRNTFLNRLYKNNMTIMKDIDNIKTPEFYSEININDSILVSAYKLFYNEFPDFKDPNIMIKIQSMVAILHLKVMTMFPHISKHNYLDSKITTPESEYVRDQMFKINLLLGNDFSKIEEFNFKTYVAEKIKFIGETIRGYILNLSEEEKASFFNQFAIDCIYSYYESGKRINENSQELMLLLTKNDPKN